MGRKLIIILIFTVNWCFSQEHITLFQSKSISQNKVFKVLEYDPEDSIRYFEQYPEGIYSKYDKLGRITESNHYSSYESGGIRHSNMFKNYYMYDSLDNQIAFVQIHDEMENPFRFMQVRAFNETDTIQIARLNESHQLNSEFLFETKQKVAKTFFWGDTIKISKRHHTLKSPNDSTISMDIYYNNNGTKDSIITKSVGSELSRKFKTETVTTYGYFQNGNIKSVTINKYHYKKSRETYMIEEYYFLENGLLDKIRTYFEINKEWKVSKFKYFIRN